MDTIYTPHYKLDIRILICLVGETSYARTLVPGSKKLTEFCEGLQKAR
jgi:hypothetical protein